MAAHRAGQPATMHGIHQPTAALHVAGGSTCTNRARIPIEHRAAGLSWAKVADKLSATGHRTRTGGQWTRQGRPPGPPGARARRRSVGQGGRGWSGTALHH